MNQLRILIVEDNLNVQRLLSEVLERRDYLVTAVLKSKNAFAWLLENQCDVFLTDLGVGDMPDDEMIRTARRLAGNAKIIVLSGCGLGREHEIRTDWGADGLLLKPFLPSELIHLIESLTTAHKSVSAQRAT
jgi:DNA-binding response OmpR family regulator